MKIRVTFYYDVGFKIFYYYSLDDVLYDLNYDLNLWFKMSKKVEICKIDN